MVCFMLPNFSLSTIALTYQMFSNSSLVDRVFPPWAGDHLGRFNTAILFVASGALLVLVMWIPIVLSSSPAPTIVFAALFGWSSLRLLRRYFTRSCCSDH